METINMTAINKELLVAASQETAFRVFTENMDRWWPRSHHVGKFPMTEMVLEGRAGGRWFSRHEDGAEVNVGYVRTWEPFAHLVLIWQIDGNFQCDPDLISEVKVHFIAEGPKTTRVTLEHGDLDKLMGGAKIIESMDRGWGMIMNLYKEVADAV